jgi:hypothetical protein
MAADWLRGRSGIVSAGKISLTHHVVAGPLPDGRCFFRAMLAIALATMCVSLGKATTLPVAPITFGTNADFDKNFWDESAYPGITRVFSGSNGYVQLNGYQTGVTVYDTSATGGANGQGGTGGSDANGDLSNFTISADLASTLPTISGGFLLRLNNNNSYGYLAHAYAPNSTQIQFDLYRNASVTTTGTRIFTKTVPISGPPLAANTFYNVAVTASGGTFSFNFAHGEATATFTDTAVSATVGEVGFVLDTPNPFTPMELDNFAITPAPEPSSVLLLATALAGFPVILWRRRLSKGPSSR